MGLLKIGVNRKEWERREIIHMREEANAAALTGHVVTFVSFVEVQLKLNTF